MDQKVFQIIADALYVDLEEVTAQANLMNDLGAESIDFLDIIFRLEKEFEVKIPRGEIEQRAKGNLTDDEFAVDGMLTDIGLQRLQEVMPEIPADQFKSGLFVRDIASLFTAQTFVRMVQEQLDAAASELPTATRSASAAVAAH